MLNAERFAMPWRCSAPALVLAVLLATGPRVGVAEGRDREILLDGGTIKVLDGGKIELQGERIKVRIAPLRINVPAPEIQLRGARIQVAPNRIHIQAEQLQIAAIQVRAFEINEKWFDQWIFRGTTSGKSKARLLALLELQVAAVDRSCELTEEQREKLKLAGRGDIKWLFDELDDARDQFLTVRRDQEKFNKFWPEVQPLQGKLNSGIFDESSFFHRILKRTLDPEQTAQYDEQERRRKKFRYEAKLGVVVATLESGMPLRDEQRKRLLKLLTEKTRPPQMFGQYDYYVIMLQVARLPEEQVKPIFDDAQWRALSQHLLQAKGMEPFLKQNGFLPAVKPKPAF